MSASPSFSETLSGEVRAFLRVLVPGNYMADKLHDDDCDPPEELKALAAMFDVNWYYIHGYGARTWELALRDWPNQRHDYMARRTQSTFIEDWLEIIKELIEHRDGPL